MTENVHIPSVDQKDKDNEAKSEQILLGKQQLDLTEETHAHERAMHAAELGWVGKFIGSKSEKPGNISAIVILLCIILVIGAFFALDTSKQGVLFERIFSGSMAIVTLALGYLFGSKAQ